jgi:hypothetical protein
VKLLEGRLERPQTILADRQQTPANGVGSRETRFVDWVRDAQSKVGAQEFNLARAEAMIRRLGVDFSAEAPRSRLSSIHLKLDDEKYLVKAFLQSGGVPDRPRLRSLMSGLEAKNFEDAQRQTPEQGRIDADDMMGFRRTRQPSRSSFNSLKRKEGCALKRINEQGH